MESSSSADGGGKYGLNMGMRLCIGAGVKRFDGRSGVDGAENGLKPGMKLERRPGPAGRGKPKGSDLAAGGILEGLALDTGGNGDCAVSSLSP